MCRRSVVSLRVCLSVFVGHDVNPAKTAGPSTKLFEGESGLSEPKKPRDWVYPHWRHLTNTTKQSVRVGDAALCRITVTCCFYFIDVRINSLTDLPNSTGIGKFP